MDNLPRLSFYSSGILLITAAVTLFSAEFLIKVGDPGITGFFFLTGFGLIYMNIVFVISRRFMRRENGPSQVPKIFAILVGSVPVIWVFIFDSGLTQIQQIVYAVTVSFGCVLGAYFGHNAGLKAQAKFKKQLEEYLSQTQSSSDNLSESNVSENKS